jgi:hypothetical protein
MSYHLTVVRYILLVISFFAVQQSSATDKDSLDLLKLKAKNILHLNIDKSVTIEGAKKFDGLDKYLEQQVFSIQDGATSFDNAFYDSYNNTADTTLAAYRAMADNATKEMDAANHFVDYLQPSDIYQLPVGFKKKIGTGSEITIAVSSAIFKPTYAELTVFARLTIPQFNNGKPIFFGIQGLKLSYTGGIIGNARLVLLGDIAIPINGNSTALILRGGGFNTSTGTAVADDKTYIALDCKGFKEIGLTADLQFSRNMIVPVSATTGAALPTGNVTANFTHLVVSNWNDIITTVNFDKPFQIKGVNGFVFTVQTAAFDFSDLRNNPDIVYPIGYKDKYLQANNLNVWRGVYVKQLSLALPKSFKNKEQVDSNARVTFGVNDLIIDNNGLTGVFFADNILPLKKGNAAGWKFSVDSLRIAVEASQLRRAGFGGRLGLPVNKTSDADTLSKNKFLGYSASISFSGDYVCKVITQDTLDFNVFVGRVVLLPNSYVQLRGGSESFQAEAMLHGKIGIKSNILKKGDGGGGRSDIADMKGITFRGLHVTSYAPYFTAEYFGYEGVVKFGNFPLSFEKITLIKPNATTVGISFNAKLNLGSETDTTSNSFSGKVGLAVMGEINNESGGILSWEFQKIRIDSVIIKATLKESFKFDGYVKFFDDTIPTSPRYGRGFEGGLKVEFLKGLKIKVQLKALFAKAPTFRYWYVDGKVDLGTGIGAAPFRVRGFAGGVYSGMKKTGYGDPFSGTGINYAQDSTAGLGVKASLLFDGGTKVLSGEASFEIAFNKGGGLRYIGFFGMVRLSEDILPAGLTADGFLGKQLKKLTSYEQSLSTVDLAKFTALKETDPSKAATIQKKGSETNAAAGDKDPADNAPGVKGISAYIGIQYDFNASTLHANFDMYINAAGGLITGVGDNNRAGWAVFHVQPGKWYLHVGKPTDPIGVKFGIGSFYIKTTAYFMLGHDMPAFPPPPPQVISILAQAGLNYSSNMSSSTVAGGRGIAFGAAVHVQTGDLRFLIFYANFSAGLGFDVMLKDFGNSTCDGNKVGINGWYAMGQAYAYFQGELGLKIKLFFIKKNIVLIKGGAAALLQAKMPRPTWVGGALGFYVQILGGLIKGNFAFKFSFGNDCQIVYNAPPAEEDIKIIEELKPENNGVNIDVFYKPTVKFRLKPGSIIEIPRPEGGGNDYYKANLDFIKILKGDTSIPVIITYNSNGDFATIKPSSIFRGTTLYKLSVKVSLQKFVNGNWITYIENGQVVEELKEVNFTTGTAPVELPIAQIRRLYPFYNQRNYYKDEPNKGIVKLDVPWEDFFTNFDRWKVKIETLSGVQVSSVYATTAEFRYFYFTMPNNLQFNTTYNFILKGEGANNQSLDTSKPAITFKFTTSNYPTFASKINAIQMVQPIVGRVASDVIDLQAGVSTYEGFELYELVGNQYTENLPMIEAEADVTDEPYFNQVLKPLYYTSNPINNTLLDSSKNYTYILGPGLDQYGIPAYKAVTPSWYYVNSLSNGTYSNLLKTRMAFVHNTNKYMNLQFLDYRKQIIERYINFHGSAFGTASANIKDIVNKGFPFMLTGNYKAKLTFVQLDNPRTRGTTGEFIYQNPIE